MKVMVLIKANKESEAGVMPDEKFFVEMGKYNEALVKAGVLVDAAGLFPSSHSKRVHFSKQGVTVLDGPFAETKELIAGYWVWKVESLDEAVAWVKRCPSPEGATEGDIEIRQVFEADCRDGSTHADASDKKARLEAQLSAKA